MSSIDKSNNYEHFFDEATSPAELLLKFEIIDRMSQGSVLSTWNPEFLLKNRTDLLPYVMDLYLHMQGNYDDDIIVWMHNRKDMFKKYHQLKVFSKYTSLYLEMKKLRDKKSKKAITFNLEDIPLGKCCKCHFEQFEATNNGYWNTCKENEWICFECIEKHKIELYPMACEWCSFKDVNWHQGHTYTCPRCSFFQIGQSAKYIDPTKITTKTTLSLENKNN